VNKGLVRGPFTTTTARRYDREKEKGQMKSIPERRRGERRRKESQIKKDGPSASGGRVE